MARICILLNNFEPPFGGPELQAQKVALRLLNKGHQVIYVAKGSGNYPSYELMDGIPLFRLKRKGLASIDIYLRLWQLRDRFDVIYAHGLGRFVSNAVSAARLLCKEVFVEVTTTGNIRKPCNNLRGFLRKFNPLRSDNVRMLKEATGVVAISKEILREIKKEGIEDNKIHYAPVGVDTKLFCPVNEQDKMILRAKLGLPQGKSIVIFTGKIRRLKAVDVLIHAWERSAFLQEHAILLLVGSGRKCADSLEAFVDNYINSKNLCHSIIRIGDVVNVQEYLAASDIFAFPSRSEGLPNSLLEAMATGLVCIASDIPGNVDVIIDRQTGLLVPVGDCAALSRTIEEAIRRPLPELGEKARELVATNYNIEQRINTFEEIITNIS